MWASRLVAVCLIAASSCSAAIGDDGFAFRRVAYNYHSLANLNGTGFDAVYVPLSWGSLTWDKAWEWAENRLKQRSLELAPLGTKVIAGPYYCVPPAPDTGNYSHAVGKDKPPEAVVPSPVDEIWWSRYVEVPGIAIANLSLYYPIWGIAWDWERYIEGRSFEREEYSYDEAAVQAFARATNRTIPYVPPTERYSWLWSHGLVEEFHRWQEGKLYSMAKGTERKIHAINPNLSLGLLGFTNDWFPWTVLGAFNSSTAPVTGWCEETYGGYYMVEPSVSPQSFRELWTEKQLNGMFLPAIWGLAPGYGHGGVPWSVLTEMEAATRDNGAFWVYEWDYDAPNYPFESRGKTYQIFNSFIFFNTSSPTPLPAFDLYPGVQARPYLGPGGTVSVLLRPYAAIVPSNFTILSDSELWYVGENLSIKLLGSDPTMRSFDIGCILSGLSEEDLLATQTWAMIEELDNLTQFYRRIGAGRLLDAENVLSRALEDFQAGRYLQARSLVLGVRESLYQTVLNDIWPTVQNGLASPRSSKIPITILRSISDAKRILQDGKSREAEAYLFDGLRQWSAAVREPGAMLLLLAVVLLRRRSCAAGDAA